MSLSRRAARFLAVLLLSIAPITTAPASLAQNAATQPATRAPQDKRPLSNQDITRMSKGGFGESVIINAIQTNDTQFDVSLDALFRLKEAGVSQKVIEAMQSASVRQNAARTSTGQPAPAGTPPASITQAPLPQPYLLYGGADGTSLPAAFPTIVQTKAKGDSVPALLADSAVQGIASDVITSVAARSILSAPGIASMPIIGMAGVAILSLPKVFGGEPTYTFVYALGGRSSATVISTPSPQFEITFDDVVGANPDGVEPALVKVSPTSNNWRLVGAQRAKAKQFQSGDRSECNFIEERVPARVTRLDRGRASITPEQPLAPGEYGIVLRPVSKTQKVSLKEIAYRQGEGLLLGPVWDFSVAPVKQQAPAQGQALASPQAAGALAKQTSVAPNVVPEARTAGAELPKASEVPGSVSIQTKVPYDRAYEVALDVVKRAGYTIESASRESGQIKTELVIEHGAVDIGRAVVVTLLKEAGGLTTVRVTAYKQGRRIGGQWQQRVGTKEKAQKLAEEIQAALART